MKLAMIAETVIFCIKTPSSGATAPCGIANNYADIDNHTLLEYACVSLTSANVMASDFARDLKGSQGITLLGIQQSIMLGKWR
ncbi:hypothetical protein CES87_28555 [Pseudomonas sp. ERMR1:02]|nr:hypothetical protein CES87_28555 [Pseudomonas sp. ERMR1:02]